MDKKKFKTVDEYFQNIPRHTLERMEIIRKALKETASLAEEVISYNMPALKYHGILMYYAAYEKHIGFYAVPSTHETFKEELSNYKAGKGSVQFPNDEPLPLDLIKRMAAYRYKEKLDASKE
ncbi:iron chaperone [Flagellimonas iocasae]|uniref:Iron chaperone n=1 Tax=Flagellimonas iocasae TaxID=2055905 RepID=A0ABW4XVB2_9FLAO